MSHHDEREPKLDPKADATRDEDLRESARHQQRDDAADRGVKVAEEAADTAGRGVEPEVVPSLSEDESRASPQTELEILRGELAALQARVDEAEREAEEGRDRALRARAELDTARRRAANEEERARRAGLDSALAPVLSAFDDLRRALAAAESGDPEQIVPGVRSVMEGLERNLARLDVHRVGEVGQAFDHDLHEALTTVPAPGEAQAGTIAEVFEAGFREGDRLVRPARVVVYHDGEDG